MNQHDVPLGHQQITSLSSSTGLTVPDGTSFCMIQAETQSIRWRDDGTVPTASVGMLLAAGDTLHYTGKTKNLRIIETTASAKINVSYYG
jgi:hypothetical protein